MKRTLLTGAALLTLAVFVTGCFTSATAHTKKTAPDGIVTESKVTIIGTGDKVSAVAAEGLFADGTDEDLGAGVKKASANQQSTGIDGTLNGLGQLMAVMAKFMAASPGVPVKVPAVVETDEVTNEASTAAPGGDAVYSPEGYGGTPGADGSGTYGNPSCGRCRAYRAAHPDVSIINIDDAGNRAAMWSALRSRGFSGSSVALPVSVTSTAFTAAAR